MTPMRILYVIHQFYPEFRSGTEKFLLNLASNIQKDGHFVEVMTYTFSDSKEGFRHNRNLLVQKYNYKNLPVTAVRHQTLPIDIHTSCENPEIYMFAQEYLGTGKRFDLVHFAHPMRLGSFARAALESGIPYMLTLTDYWMICPKFFLRTSRGGLCAGAEGSQACIRLCSELDASFIKQRSALIKEILFGAKYLVSPSKFLAAVFQKEFPGLAVSIIPHGMDFKYLKLNSRDYKQGDKIIFAYCGGLSPHKGIHLLLKAFLNLNPPNGELRLYGSCFHEKEYLRFLHDIAGRDERISFCGTYSEEQVGEVLSNIDVLVLPSLWYENYPLVLHESLACNVPVIASNIGGMAEKIKDSVNGFTFEAGDERSLELKLRLILGNPQILNGIKQNLRQQVLPLIEEEAYLYERLCRTAAI